MDTQDSAAQARLYRRLLGRVKRYWPMFLIAFIGNVLYSAVDSYSIHLFKPFLDKGFMDKDMHFLRMMPFIILGLFLLRGVGSFLSTYFMGGIGRRMVLHLREDVFKKLLSLPASYYDAHTTGELLGKLTYNVAQVTQATGDSLTTLVREGSFVIGLLVVMLITSWEMTLFVLFVIPLVAGVVLVVSKRFRRVSRRIQSSIGDVTHIADETIGGYRDVKVFAGQQKQQGLFDHVNRYNYLQEMKLILTDAISTPIIQFIGACALALVLYVMFHGSKPLLSVGGFVTLLSAMLAILKPIKNLSRVNSSIQRGLAATESIFEIFDQSDERDRGKGRLDHVKGRLRFEQVFFKYPQHDTPVLDNFSIDIAPGKTVAFVGRSGGGKSTVVSLLARFYEPCSGQITCDGHDIHGLGLADWRSNIALVSQHVSLFNDTLFNNIAYGAGPGVDVSEAQVVNACEKAHAWGFIEAMPEGLQTMIGENGLSLSGGQRQRVAIARALLKDAPILILDEATSALDTQSEKAIQAALETLREGRTVIIVAHRLSTIESADQIVVLDQGQVIEQGEHQQLLALGGVYAQLHASAVF